MYTRCLQFGNDSQKQIPGDPRVPQNPRVISSVKVSNNCLRYANPAALNRSFVSTCVRLCWCACVLYIYIYIYIYVYLCMCMCIYIYIYVYEYGGLYVLATCAQAEGLPYIYIYIYMCVFVPPGEPLKLILRTLCFGHLCTS